MECHCFVHSLVFPGDSSPQARKILRELKHQKRCEEAATTIAAYWHGTQVGRRLPPEGSGSGGACGPTDPLLRGQQAFLWLKLLSTH